MNRIERNGYTYPAWMDSDEHVIESLRPKRSQRRESIEIAAIWIGALAFCFVFWYGVARAVDMGLFN